MSTDLLWAVTDGPAGTRAVPVPEDPSAARRLQRHDDLWCARQAGGCGGRLLLRTGAGARPHLEHDGPVSCAFAGGGGPSAERAYDHLRYQHVLTAWLSGQGHRPQVRTTRHRDGSTDLHLVVDDAREVLEVALAPVSDVAWRQRDDRLRARFPHVTWLFGPAAAAAADTEAAVRGVSLVLRRHGADLAVGVRDDAGGTRWVRLSACSLTADGFSVPGADDARTRHARRSADREESARLRARQATREPGRGARGRRPAAARPWTALLPPLPFPG
ncbi:hypothetical protein JOD57_000190 [Geodermatophilus bullaregiensis]|uniref:hypothetical protein n=1 Tax=Geodermatophilus bullaregiensis TaxID=1564160 RepID=UPI0019572B43|nr:hypothetical protein [Geodermatophilus bullaregiensis]MBM7804353.1 hypothetical protein [Geodermatophilus bullaregiensis]